jgi:hypothetical protein
MSNSPTSKSANLPMARVKTIMKSSPDVENVAQDSLFLITRATVRLFWFKNSNIKIAEFLSASTDTQDLRITLLLLFADSFVNGPKKCSIVMYGTNKKQSFSDPAISSDSD